VYEIMLWVTGGATAATNKAHLLDIGVDEAGGTSYTAIVSNIVCGGSAAPSSAGYAMRLPLFISAGASLAVRVQGAAGTAGTVYVMCRLLGGPTRPDMVRSGKYAETIGTITGSLGVTVAASNGAKGSWVSMGTATKELWWVQPFFHCTSTGYGDEWLLVDVAIGDGSNKHIIVENCCFGAASISENFVRLLHPAGNWRIPAGSTLYMRAAAVFASTTNHGVLVGIGG
jgi:hypothetical protein